MISEFFRNMKRKWQVKKQVAKLDDIELHNQIQIDALPKETYYMGKTDAEKLHFWSKQEEWCNLPQTKIFFALKRTEAAKLYEALMRLRYEEPMQFEKKAVLLTVDIQALDRVLSYPGKVSVSVLQLRKALEQETPAEGRPLS